MNLTVGIVGLPNVGKSTTFNALTKAQNAEAANYPFCTIEPNKAIVTVPDARLDRLTELVKPQKTLYATVQFVDIAGLVKGASKGEGLGNKFLGNIRDTSVIIHVVRCFEDENVIHVSSLPNPREDVDVINMELIFADLDQLERKIERLVRQVRADKKLQSRMDMAEKLKDHLEQGLPILSFAEKDEEEFIELNSELRFLTGKKVIYVANVDEEGLAEDNKYVQAVRELAAEQNAEVVKLCAKLEEELVGLTEEEREEFLLLSGIEEVGLDQVIRKAFLALGLITYFTAGEKEVRAWTIMDGWSAPQAAGVIHTDFERGFISAEITGYEQYIHHGSEAAAKAAGVMRVEGKSYMMKDGDVVHFRFNV